MPCKASKGIYKGDSIYRYLQTYEHLTSGFEVGTRYIDDFWSTRENRSTGICLCFCHCNFIVCLHAFLTCTGLRSTYQIPLYRQKGNDLYGSSSVNCLEKNVTRLHPWQCNSKVTKESSSFKASFFGGEVLVLKSPAIVPQSFTL